MYFIGFPACSIKFDILHKKAVQNELWEPPTQGGSQTKSP